MPAIASIVRSIAASLSAPVSSRPSPRRVTSARSTQRPPGAVLASLREVELDRVRAHVHDRVARSAEAHELLRAPGERSCSARRRARARARPRAGAPDPPTRPRPSARRPRQRPGRSPRPCTRRRVKRRRRLCTSTARRSSRGRTSRSRSSSSVPTGSGVTPATRSAPSMVPTSAAESGNAALSTGRHCWSPSSLTRSRCFTSRRPSRTLTESSAFAREHVQLVALALALGREVGEAPRGGLGGLTGDAPLPAGDDLGHRSVELVSATASVAPT